MIRLVIPFNPSSLSSNQRLCRYARARLVRRARDTAERVWVLAGRPRLAGTLRLSIVVRHASEMDDDRILSGCTALRDALFARRRVAVPGRPAFYEPGLITLDDGPRHLRLGTIDQEIGPQWRGSEQVEFVIEEVSAAATA